METRDYYVAATNIAEILLMESRLKKEDVIGRVAEYMGVDQESIVGKKRDENIARARHAVAYIYHIRFGMSLNETGRALGGRDHSTIVHSIKEISCRLGNCPIDISKVYPTVPRSLSETA